MLVKICGITSAEDAAAAIDSGAGAIGFNFYPKSSRYIAPEAACAISTTAGVLRVGVFVDEPLDRLRQTAATARLDVVQLHGSESPSECPPDLRTWKAFRIANGWTSAALDGYTADAFLLDGPAPGSGQSFDWTIVQTVRGRILLAGGLDEHNVAQAIRTVRPWGVDACSRIESAPGRKDYQKMRAFIKAALSENL